MTKKEINMENIVTYKTLRDYVKNITNTNVTVIEGQIADVIDTSVQTVQNVSSGKRSFKWSEAKRIAECFVTICEKKADKLVLRRLLFDFLFSYGCSDEDAEVTENDIHNIVNTLLDIDVVAEDGKSVIEKRYNNLPELQFTGTIIRTDLRNKIQTAIKDSKIIFLSGITGTGKSFIAKTIAQELFDSSSDNISYAIWNECKDGNTTFNDIVINILSAFGVKNTGNMTPDKKSDAAEKYLKNQKGILVIDGFENISSRNGDKENIIQFITEKVPNSCSVILTCSERLSFYRKKIRVSNRFREFKVEKLSLDEWIELSKIREESLNDVKEAKGAFPDLDNFVYDLCKGNAYVMTHVLASVSEKLLTGISFEKIKKEYDLLDIDEGSYQKVFEKTIKDLPANCVSLLITMSLFATPISMKLLHRVSGIDGLEDSENVKSGSDLEKSIYRCHNLYMIDQYVKNESVRFCLPTILQPILNRTLKDNAREYQAIVDRWIEYYMEYSSKIGFCFDDFERLAELDNDNDAREIDNIIRVLKYCQSVERWENFYTISENTKYFFYTRGISGEGKESIHYQRALAARSLCNYVDEFDALLYHCNVMCKAQIWIDIEDCFKRMDMLAQDVQDIPERNKEKYKYLKALYAYFTGKFNDALALFVQYEKNIKSIIDRTGEARCDKMLIHDYVASLRWHCECIFSMILSEHKEQYMDSVITEMIDLLDEAILLANTVNFERAIVHSLLIKIKIYDELQMNSDEIFKILERLDDYKSVIFNDVVYRKKYENYKQRFNRNRG
ncbi:MAG: ATP-binding protein [Eubacterium sp.]|jgi:SpoVK/Ycf46/Vps4 family AAA+-type ATPase|nr:ATP-binding protein [Eubacterium sp.]